MKKFLALLLALTMALCLAACGDNSNQPAGSSAASGSGSASGNSVNFFGLWLPNLLAQALSLVLMLFAVKRLRSSYTAYFLAYFIVAVGATWLLSAPRYLAAAFTVPTALAVITHDRRADWCLTTLSVLAGSVYLCEFVLRWQVW